MSREQQSAEGIFNAARAIPDPKERDGYLQGACGSDLAMRGRIDALLKADAEAGSFLAGGKREQVAGSGEIAAEGDPDATVAHRGSGPLRRLTETPGMQIGHYRLLERIGEGGMGEVWVAEQREPVRRKVALKIVKAGMDTREVLARFEAERQALALMDHPGVAKVFDAGATDTGRPYFVMEYVAGLPIIEYCDTTHLKISDRLALFIEVCQVVQHAHQKGIIHRDLKPSNILVTVQDGKPAPKVIDFGIAKATMGRLTDRTLYTEMGKLIGTPEYMAPEQTGTSGLDVDTRADIYSLGVILYELLTGTLPFDPKTLRNAGFDAMAKIIRELEPPKPSTRLSTLAEEAVNRRNGKTPEDIARAHDTDFRTLRRELRGDLDWITLKALEKDRTRRYESASGLAADVQRHLMQEPVIAAPPGTAYKVRKFAHRHKVGVAAGITIAGVLALGIVGMSAGLAWAVRERSEKQAVIDLMREMLGAADPYELKDPDYKVRALLDDFDARFKARPIHRPEVEAVICSTMGEAYCGLGEYDKAEKHLRTALEIRQRVFGDKTSAELAALMFDLSKTLRLTGQYDEAESLARAQLELQKRRLGEDDPEVATSMNNLAWVLWPAGKRTEAVTSFQTALEMQRRHLGEMHARTADTMSGLAFLLMRMGRPAEAEPLAKKAVEVRERLFGQDAPVYLHSLSIYAGSLHDQGRLEVAEPLYRKVIESEKRVLGEEHPEVAMILHSLSFLLQETGRSAEAEPLVREALQIRQKKLNADHPDIVNNKAQLAMILLDLRRYDEAETLARECVAAPDALPGLYKFGRGRFYSMSLLGGALSGQAATLSDSNRAAAARKFSEAEPLLIEGFEGMHVPSDTVVTRRCNHDALERIVMLYEAWDAAEPGKGYAAKAEEYRALLEAKHEDAAGK